MHKCYRSSTGQASLPDARPPGSNGMPSASVAMLVPASMVPFGVCAYYGCSATSLPKPCCPCGGQHSSIHAPLCRVTSLKQTVVAVTAANKHTAVVTDSGAVYTWGSNDQGQLGYGTSDSACNPLPRQVEAIKVCFWRLPHCFFVRSDTK